MQKRSKTGCPLSPILFNIYINDIAYELEGINPAPLELPNGTLVSRLMYADDIIILSRSPEGLQKLLDYTKHLLQQMENDSKQIKNKMYDIFFKKQEKHKGFIYNWLMSSRKC